ncbi:conserved hypothetical protein [Talaromyces stipitatus ATCC 10500]|uniref:Hydroxyacyl-thioester dehydratase type 2, mitochondrial n=1 Tax=Talaromyces stipitatus (strain ATCC 10500 / CBS 375.48 / QM 6759 / NRRL 1006) TaxID=441959 RepID=B8MBZ8_TALSN|nr:uncharacterized protein TSTA_121820 [Talaromyces stipitatus ATCC 10500]EED18444.1 conserved hypothetical protein [Talaromyces stipitatus ATCC 10500]
MLVSRTCRLLSNKNASLIFKRTVSSSIDPSLLRHELTTRRLPLSYDYLTPQQSHLLNLSLPELLQLENHGEDQRKLPSITQSNCMPPGHHLVYFPPQVTLSELLPDGTDVLHTPGEPFNRRLWAGGKITFPQSRGSAGGLLLNGQRAVCVENIDNVDVQGPEGDERVLITIDRRFTSVHEYEDEMQIRASVANNNSEVLMEKRILYFMRDLDSEIQQTERDRKSRIVKAPTNPDISYTMTPTKALLFRFSALTFNAHLIHLDRPYARNTEGHHDILVHGPLTAVLMLSLLSNYLSKLGLCVKEFEYRNLAPLYVDEELRVCVKAKQQSPDALGSLGVWIEGPQGGLAARGTARAAPIKS